MGGSNQVAFRAALTRIGVGLLVVVAQPFTAPGLGSFRWLIALYIASALVAQVFIWKDIGGTGWRAILWGLIDIAFVAFLVHRLGSLSTVLVSLFVVLGMMNALVTNTRVGLSLAVLAAASYVGVLFCEYKQWLPHAPDAPYGTAPELDGNTAFAAGLFLTLLTLGATAVVGRLVASIREHEHQLEEANAQLEEANAQLEELSQRDPLTHLYNRRYLLERIEVELARVARGHSLAVLVVDLDHFKQINDEQGHLRGDECLAEIAAALANATRATDVAGRFGGDEFVVVLPDTGVEQAEVVAERLIADVRTVGLEFNADKPVTASVGMALAKPDDSANELLRRADECTYRAKAAGGNALVAA